MLENNELEKVVLDCVHSFKAEFLKHRKKETDHFYVMQAGHLQNWLLNGFSTLHGGIVMIVTM